MSNRIHRVTALAVVLGTPWLAGCYRVAETTISQVPALSGHAAGKPGVSIRTLDGDTVPIRGDFERVEIAVTENDTEREIVLFPPFSADKFEGWFVYEPQESAATPVDGAPRRQLDLESVTGVRVVQRDGDRTLIVLSIVSAASLAGFLGGAYLSSREAESNGDVICGLCAPLMGAMLFGGISLAITIPATKYY